MIQKAIIIGKDVDTPNKFIIRIPTFEGVGNSINSSDITYSATLCYTPGNTDTYLPGDIVYVSFENNQYENPVIIGKLYVGDNSQVVGAQKVNTLNVEGTTNLNGSVKVNGVSLTDLVDNSQAITNLNSITTETASKVADLALGDWIIKETETHEVLNFYRKRKLG